MLQNFLVLAALTAGQYNGQPSSSDPVLLPSVFPQGQPPVLVWARMAGKELEILQRFTVCETQQRSVTMRDEDGKATTKTVTYVVCKQVPQLKKMLVEKTKFATSAGPLDAVQASDLLKEPTPVLLAHGPVDPRYLTAFKKGMVLLTSTGHGYGAPAGPVPSAPAAPSTRGEADASAFFVSAVEQTEEIQNNVQAYLKPYAGATGPFPEVRLARVDDKGNLNLWTFTENSFSRPAQREIEVNGVKKVVTYNLRSSTFQAQGTELPPRSFKALSGKGQPIGDLELGWMLAKDRMVLVCYDNQTPAPWALALAGPDTPVLVLSASVLNCSSCYPAPAMPMAAPPVTPSPAPSPKAPMPLKSVPKKVAPQT